MVQQRVETVVVEPGRLTPLAVDATVSATVEVLDAGGSPVEAESVTWSVEDGTVATVDESGLVASSGGEAFCWGLNNFGQVGDGTTVHRWSPQPVAATGTVVQVAAGHIATEPLVR